MNQVMVKETKGTGFEVAAFSEQGPRTENQDAYAVDDFADSGLLAVADGMGGEKSGRVAADACLEVLRSSAPLGNLEAARRAIREADRTVARMSERDPDQHGGMGCALGVLALQDGDDGPGWIAAHVGDVRILSRSPDGVLRLETRDHTPAFTRWEAGEISLDEIPDSAGANRLQRAIGRGGEPDVVWLPARAGWSWLLLSDGVSKAMRLDELGAAMGASSAAAGCDIIRAKVLERGPDDNFTAVLVRATGTADPPIIAHQATTMENWSESPNRRWGRANGFVVVVSLVALILAGVALWSANRDAAAYRARIDSLRAEVDSLRTQVEVLSDPFGPTAPSPSDLPVGPTQPPPPQR